MDFDLKFLGDWSLYWAVPAGLTLAVAAWFFYRRETRHREDALSWFLPAVRALVVFLLFMILTGPVLHHRKVEGDLAKLLILVDASKSMSVNDEQMELRRKLLIAVQLGWLKKDVIDPAFREAVAASARMARTAEQTGNNLLGQDAKKLSEELADDAKAAFDAMGRLRSGSWSSTGGVRARMERDLLRPARHLADRPLTRDVGRLVRDLQKIGREASEWNQAIHGAFDDYLKKLANNNQSEIAAALKKFDSAPRWDRVQSHLLDGEDSLFSKLETTHDVELLKLSGGDSEIIWTAGPDRDAAMQKLLDAFHVSTNASGTDLSSALRDRSAEVGPDDNIAAVLISDGRHNRGDSPENLAKILGNRGMKVFTLSVGTSTPPQDLSITDVDVPDSVFHESRAKGTITLNDNMESGQRFTLAIQREGRTVWEKELLTERNPARTIPYDFPIKELVSDEIQSRDADLKLAAVPLNLEVSVTELAGEKDTSNNRSPLRFAAITEKPRALILEGRPRWEFRYLRNALERDASWDLNGLLAGGGGEERPWRRGKLAGQFPDDLETLYSYHLIIVGDLPMTMLTPEEQQWLHDYVEKRGGGIIFIDGRRTPLAFYRRTPLGNLFPVEWSTGSLNAREIKLEFTASETVAGPVSLVAGTEQNKRIWASLHGPRHVAPATALPGSEVLLKASSGEREADAIVFRRQGAGRVLYLGHDESWRWRYGIGDHYHQKFWNQIARWIMEPSFPVEDKYVALDSGALMYDPGDKARVRVRLRDAEGRLILNANAQAEIYNNGEKIASVALEGDANSGGIFRGETAPLNEGDYEVKVRVDGLPEDQMKAKTFFTVQAGGGGEMANLAANEALLRNVAQNSGGQFFREEDISQLFEQIKPLSKGRIIESETLLWQSYWWFMPIVLLLTIEWAVRKRAGML